MPVKSITVNAEPIVDPWEIVFGFWDRAPEPRTEIPRKQQ